MWVHVQTFPIFGRRDLFETGLIRQVRRSPGEAVVYCQTIPVTISDLPDDGILVVNDLEVVAPFIVKEGDVILWIPGPVC